MLSRILSIAVFVSVIPCFCLGQAGEKWQAKWIQVPNQPPRDFGVYLFRKGFELSDVPSSFQVNVSADNRYKLYVNATLVSVGPARGDVFHWNYETVDIAKYLKPGKNVIASIVWNEGALRPLAQISEQTAFILQGSTPGESFVNTNASWKCIRDTAFHQLRVQGIYGYYAAGPGEDVDMRHHAKGWNRTGFNDSNWLDASQLFNGLPKGVFDWASGWMLVPSPLPAMELRLERLVKTRRSEGITLPASFPAIQTTVTIPANNKVTIILDQTYLTNAYFTLIISQGKDADVSIRYAESLYEGKDNVKGDRSAIEGKRFVGYQDKIKSDGSTGQEFTTRWWRTYRYIELSVTTKAEALIIDDLYGTFTGYPFKNNSTFSADDKSLSTILDIGWRTARLCAVETYMDCPYYEQLQYIGDTRIQALVSLYNSGDDRLMRNAINQMDYSRLPEGITLSRFPSSMHQEIPPFSLWWIGMLDDYYRYRNDPDFVKEKLPCMRSVLSFFNHHQQSDGLLKNPPYWNFSDWCKEWYGGIPPFGKNGNSSILDFQLLWAYQIAARLESDLGMKEYAEKYSAMADKLKTTIEKVYWNAERGLYADTPEKSVYSQHANALAILTHVAEGRRNLDVASKLMKDSTIVQASIYFKYYLHQALIKVGMGSNYLQWLDKWRENISLGLTTWAEMSDVMRSRSDCHAWGASPNIEFFRTVLGIDSNAPGFKDVLVAPNLGSLKSVQGKMPHPNGSISVNYRYEKKKWYVDVTLPPGTTGKLIWLTDTKPLVPGKNTFTF